MATETSMSQQSTQSSSQGHLQSLFESARVQLGNQILGQRHLTDRLLIALLSDGHLLVEGAPGLAKTRAIKSLAGLIDSDFHRVQFTPDLLPSDLTGTDIYDPQQAIFKFQKGPLFHNIILADEINRAPAKVQSALLEAMAERQITIGKTTHPLPELFMVMATQNPIEQEGTYPLPEAQLDRFLLHVNVDYPSTDVESRIMELAHDEALQMVQGRTRLDDSNNVKISTSEINAAREETLNIFLSQPIQEYIVQLILATRNPQAYNPELKNWIEYGASPRGSIGLERVARAHAWLSGRDFVSPDDVQSMIHDALRHRLILSFSAEAEGIDTDHVISRLLELVPVP
jgi:MoxR-like ATPase